MSADLRAADSAPNVTVLSAPRGVWSQSRIAGAFVLAAWAALFWWLLLTGRFNLYLSTRTAWVVPVGATLLTAAAVGRLAAARSMSPEDLGRREAVIMALMVMPVVLVMVLPPATLGSFSASKKTSFSSTTLSNSFYDQITTTSEITLLSVAAAQTSDEGARALSRRAGSDVNFVGMASYDPGAPADEFLLTRYVITCCVSDATIVQVRVVNVAPGSVQPDDWVQVTGQIYPLGRTILVNADSVRIVSRPARPYLTP
jgi:uncharacterized repeat protein (TIGR03943 family)